MHNIDRVLSSSLVWLKAYWCSSVYWYFLFFFLVTHFLVWYVFSNLWEMIKENWPFCKMICIFDRFALFIFDDCIIFFIPWRGWWLSILQHGCGFHVWWVITKNWHFWGENFNERFAKSWKCYSCVKNIMAFSMMILYLSVFGMFLTLCLSISGKL